MARENKPWSVHIRFNDRNPRQAQAAQVLDTIPPKYKNAFLTLAIESYMATRHPVGVNLEEIVALQKETDRSYKPKTPIKENLARAKKQARTEVILDKPAPLPAKQESAAVDDAIEKAMAMFGVNK